MADGSVPKTQTQENNPEVAPEAAPETARQERVDLALDRQKEALESPTEKAIDRFDAEKNLSEQTESLKRLQAVIDQLVIKALQQGAKKEDLKKSPGEILKYTASDLEKTTAQKWLDAYRIQPLAARTLWSIWLDTAEKEYTAAVAHKESLENGKVPEGTEWMSSGLRWGLVAAGAFGAYELYHWFTEKKEDKKADQLILGASLTTLGVGALVAPELMGKWSAEYLNLYVGDKAFKDFWSNVKKGEYLAAIKSLSFSTECPGVAEVAKKLNINERTVIDLKDTNWETFNSFHSNAERTAKSYLNEGLKAVGWASLPGVSFDDEAKTAADEVALQNYILRHANKIDGDIKKMSIGEILTQLQSKKIFEASEDGASDSSEETASSGTEVPYDWLKTKAAVEGYKNGSNNLEDVVSAATSDGVTLALKEGKTYALKGGVLILLSSLEIVTGQIQDIVEAAEGQRKWSSVPFEKDQIYWFGSYAAFNGLSALYKGKSWPAAFVEAGKGGARGILDSYVLIPKLAFKGYKLAQITNSDRKYLSFRVQSLSSYSPEEQLHVLRDETSYYAEQYTRYLKLWEDQKSEKWSKKAVSKAKEWAFGENWYKKMTIKYGKKFIESREHFFKQAGIQYNTITDKEISLGQVEKDEDARTQLKTSAEAFDNAHPASALPEAPRYLTKKTSFASNMEASKKSVPELLPNPELYERMQKLGLDNDRVFLRLREAKLTNDQLTQLVNDLEKSTSPREGALSFETKLFAIKNPNVLRNWLRLKKGVGVLAAVSMFYELQTSKDKWDTLAEEGTGTGAFLLGEEAGQYLPIPNPIVKEIAAGAVGMVSAAGGSELWEREGKPYLEKYFPNRQQMFNSKAADYISRYTGLISGSTAIGTMEYAADALGIGDSIDENTNPLSYLEETKYTWHPDYVKAMFNGGDWWPYGDHRMHDLDDLRENAQQAFDKAEAQSKALDQKIAATTDSKDKEKLKAQKEQIGQNILNFKSYMDDSWVDISELQILQRQTEMVEPAFQQFKNLVTAHFHDTPHVEAYVRLMQKMQKGEKEVDPGAEMEVWQFLCDTDAKVGEGNISFVDFATLAIATYRDAEFLSEIKKDPSLQKATPSESTETGEQALAV